MIFDDIKKMLDSNNVDTEVRFVNHEDSRYLVYAANLTDSVKSELGEMITNKIDGLISYYSKKGESGNILIESYSPTSFSNNNAVESIDLRNNDFASIRSILINQIISSSPIPLKTLKNEWSKIQFTAISIKTDIDSLTLLSMNHQKTLAKGTVATELIDGNSLKIANSKNVEISDNIDIMLFNEELLILNHDSFDKIIFLRDFLNDQVNNFNDIVVSTRLQLQQAGNFNGDGISDDCLNYICNSYARSNQEHMKEIWHIMLQKDRIKKIFLHLANVSIVKDMFDLSINYNPDTNQIVMPKQPRAVKELFRCLTDKYYLSYILKEPGIDEGKK